MKTIFVVAFVIGMLMIGVKTFELGKQVMQDSRTAYDYKLITE